LIFENLKSTLESLKNHYKIEITDIPDNSQTQELLLIALNNRDFTNEKANKKKRIN